MLVKLDSSSDFVMVLERDVVSFSVTLFSYVKISFAMSDMKTIHGTYAPNTRDVCPTSILEGNLSVDEANVEVNVKTGTTLWEVFTPEATPRELLET